MTLQGTRLLYSTFFGLWIASLSVVLEICFLISIVCDVFPSNVIAFFFCDEVSVTCPYVSLLLLG